MLNWLLILSITMISASMLMFLSAYISITEQASNYYGISKESLLYFYNSFNLFYLILSPLVFTFVKKYYYEIVCGSVVLNFIGIFGRFLAGNNFQLALFMTALVGIAHVPIITAPYGLLKLFKPHHQGYAAAIPLFLPALGINYVIFHGINFIIPHTYGADAYVRGLNIVIAIFAAVATVLTLTFLTKLKKQIKYNQQEHSQETTICDALMRQYSRIKPNIIYFIGWGTILGINWTYGGMFSYFLEPTDLSSTDIALIGFYANLSSVVFSNLGTFISNNTRFSNSMIIFSLNLIGFFASLFIQASTAILHPYLQNKTNIIIAIIILRAGLSAFVNLSLVELQKSGINSVLSSLIFFYVANFVNLMGNELAGLMEGRHSLTILSLVIWFCIFIVHLRECTQGQKYERYMEEGITVVESESQLENKREEINENEEINDQSEQIVAKE